MKQYLDVLKKIMDEGTDRPDRTGVGSRAIFGVPMRFNMADGFPAVTTKKLAFEAVKAELLWFLSGSSDVKELQKLGCHIWVGNANADYWKPKAKFEGDLGRVYGVQWRSWKSPYTDVPIDQISNIISQLKKNPGDRRIIASSWNPAELDMMALPPCHYGFQVTVIDGKLNLLWNQRSVDVALGLPFNIASYGLLLHLLAKETGLREGKLIGFLGDVHIYTNHHSGIKEQLTRETKQLPTLKTPHFKSIFDWKYEDSLIEGYAPHPSIKFEIAV